jgi:hypothetical protein
MSKYIKKTNNLRGGKLDLSKILICESDIMEATVPTTKQQWDELIVPRDFILAFLKYFIINKIFHQATPVQISSMESGGNISFYFVNNLGNLYEYLNEQKKKINNSLNVDDILSNLKNQKTYISIYTEVEKICKSLGIRLELTEEQLILDEAQAKIDAEKARLKLEQAKIKLEQEEQARIDAEKANNISIKKEDLKAIIDGVINTSGVPVIQQNTVKLLETINYGDDLSQIVSIKKTGLDAYLESLMKNFFDMLFTYLKKIHIGRDVTTLNLKMIKKNLYKEITDKINNSMSGGRRKYNKKTSKKKTSKKIVSNKKTSKKKTSKKIVSKKKTSNKKTSNKKTSKKKTSKKIVSKKKISKKRISKKKVSKKKISKKKTSKKI